MSRRILADLVKAGLKLNISLKDTLPSWDDMQNMSGGMVLELCTYHWNDPEWPIIGGAKICYDCPIFHKRRKEMPPQILGQIREAKGDLDPNVKNRLFGEF